MLPPELPDPDLNAAESSGPDSGGPDSGGPDTGGPDTGGLDTGGLDTGGPDTGGPGNGFLAYEPRRLTPEQMRRRARSVYRRMARRRSVRHFSAEPVPRELIELAIATASTAPSGAHRQPWRFVAVSNPEIKRRIRRAAEQEEYATYEGGRMPAAWRDALAPLGTDWRKPYLETVPWIVVVFEEIHAVAADGAVIKNYYVKESVGIACGMLIMALHQMGLSTLTHTPSPMGFLSRILGRPDNERPFVLLPIGYPAAGAVVPDLRRKGLEEVASWLE